MLVNGRKFEWSGVMTALVTPMDAQGGLDLRALGRLVDAQIEGGVAALVPCGTTGEAPTLSFAELRQVIETVVARADGRVPVIAGAGANSTAKACEQSRMAADAGAHATLQVAPYYNKPTQSGLRAHFEAVAEATALPLVLYNIPGRSAVRIEAETIAQLAAHPRIVAVKEATGDLGFASRVVEVAPDLVLLSGDDALALPMIALGARGVISVASNVAPALMVELVARALAGDLAAARSLHHRLYPLLRTLFAETNPIPIKAAVEMCGGAAGGIRLPLEPATPATRELLAPLLERLGIRATAR